MHGYGPLRTQKMGINTQSLSLSLYTYLNVFPRHRTTYSGSIPVVQLFPCFRCFLLRGCVVLMRKLIFALTSHISWHDHDQDHNHHSHCHIPTSTAPRGPRECQPISRGSPEVKRPPGFLNSNMHGYIFVSSISHSAQTPHKPSGYHTEY